jgi:hypothetical protein
MRKTQKTRLLLLLSAVIFVNANISAQIELIGSMLAAGPDDAEALLQPYITPAANAFGAALGSGWYNTAEPHKLGGFDITFTTSAAIIPTKYETSLIDDSQLTNLQLNDPLLDETPTVAGSGDFGPMMDYTYAEYTQPAFNMPGGLNTNYVPSPMIQAGIGLIKGTEVMVRYMPNIHYKDNEIGFWGLGGKHDIGQWIPGLKKVPALHLAVMYGYTKLHTYVDLNVLPTDINAGTLPGAGDSDWENQQMTLLTQSHTANVVASFSLPVISFYGGLGFVTTKSNLKFEGDYPSVDIDNGNPYVKVLTDPIDMEIKNQIGGLTKPRFNAGLRLKFAFVTLHFDYSWANYSVITAGLGFSFR